MFLKELLFVTQIAEMAICRLPLEWMCNFRHLVVIFRRQEQNNVSTIQLEVTNSFH